MKNKTLPGTIVFTVVVLLTVTFFAVRQQKQTITEKQAIAFIQQKYPELKDYPSDKLPPRTIITEKEFEGWYVAFVQNGSGRPILEAKCFFLKSDYSIAERTFVVPVTDMNLFFSARQCATVSEDPSHKDGQDNNQIGTCKIENCHGLDIQCGSKQADICTAIYALGDKCLKHASCGIENGKCQQIQNPKFAVCKSCVENCLADYKNEQIKLFECENKCE